ncbi:ankyrin repeat-containing domain protein [Aspergillus navahoensis]
MPLNKPTLLSGSASSEVRHQERSIVKRWAGFTRHLPKTLNLSLDTGMYDHGKANEALHLSSQAGYEELARMLLPRNDLDSEPNGGPPLCKAAFRGHGRVVQLLLERGASVDCRDVSGATRLTLNVGAARTWRSEQIIKLLVEAGADVNAMDEMGHTRYGMRLGLRGGR